MRMWCRMPIPALLLFAFWLLPVAPLITPSTLTIQSVLLKTTASIRTPRVDFTSMNFASISRNSSAPIWPDFQMSYLGPQFHVQKSVQGSLVSGAIMPIAPPGPNSTWSLDFLGPALSCKAMGNSESLRNDIITKLYSDLDFGETQYLSWVPANGKPWAPETISVTPEDSSPGSSQYDTTQRAYDRIERSYYLNNTYLLQCTLQNASYGATFSYINGVQNVTLSTLGTWNNVSYLDGFTASAEESANASLNLTSVQTFAYQAVMDTFASMLVGSVRWGAVVGSGGQVVAESTSMPITDTSMATTVLLQAREMTNVTQLLTSQSDLLATVQWVGTSVYQDEPATQSMAELMEEMFCNVTISLMSNVALNPNYTSPFAPPNATVQMWMLQNLYQYTASTLWITYGAAIGLSALSVLVGATVVLTERAAYSTCFSTLLRVANNLYLPISLKLQDTTGQDPLPRHLSSMVVQFPPMIDFSMAEKAAAGNSWNGKEVTALLLDRRGDQITITEELIKAAANNEGNGKEVMALLHQQRPESFAVSITKKSIRLHPHVVN
ncbi:hypothetical protein NKR23_g422 [Pleurostoma richardsiae]|uniref:Uncharacterized protein n=1 Tax=Pleurostoma richardsiae TaxID=41990 RepID=A0AA38W139_9PEZI|nr:hypothetical protein NKR23_g422 [Pleurostoma richardsiae]